MAEATLWTLDELVQLAQQALSVDYEGPPSARVRDLPDRRLVRWYVTRGLVDRPAATNGRNALYGRRHLLQLVAIKRRQAQGRSLAQIQAELAGATDQRLEQVARLSMAPAAATVQAPARHRSATQRPRFWAERPTALPAPSAKPSETQSGTPARSTTGPVRSSSGPDRAPDQVLPPAPTEWPLRAIELSPGITLLVAARCVDVGADAVRAAAQPLLDLLVPATTDERSKS